jgi:hypothetical protein
MELCRKFGDLMINGKVVPTSMEMEHQLDTNKKEK